MAEWDLRSVQHWRSGKTSSITVHVIAQMERSPFAQTFYHGTRPDLALLVLRDGLKSSQCSHGVTGVWACESFNYPLEWGVMPLDIFPGCFVTIGVPPEQNVQKKALWLGSCVKISSM